MITVTDCITYLCKHLIIKHKQKITIRIYTKKSC